MIGQKQPPATLLGIAFENGRVDIAQVRRTGDSFEVQKSLTVPLSTSPTNANAAILGQEIRQALQQHGIKEHRCVVSIPVHWVLSLSTKIPDIPAADIADFLSLEAERNLPYDPESLFISSSRCDIPAGEHFANVAAVQRDHVLNIQGVLRAARLKPLSCTIGLAAIQQVFLKPAAPELILVLGSSSIEVGIPCGNGLFTMRALENAPDGSLDSDMIGRELRVTLGQLPPTLRGQLVTARLFAPAGTISQAKTELASRLRSIGLAVEPPGLNSEANAKAVAVAAAYLLGKRSGFEFLPPKASAWKEFAGKTSARKLAWAAGIAAAALVLLLLAFLIQGWQLAKLQSRWSAMAPRVTELEEMQGQIKKFRPWFDNSFRSLTILRKLTEAFPVDGVVTAKTLEIRNQSQVTCSGTARDNQALFKMLDQLRGTKEVADVKMEQIRGKSPLQFNFNYRWVEGGTGEH